MAWRGRSWIDRLPDPQHGRAGHLSSRFREPELTKVGVLPASSRTPLGARLRAPEPDSRICCVGPQHGSEDAPWSHAPPAGDVMSSGGLRFPDALQPQIAKLFVRNLARRARERVVPRLLRERDDLTDVVLAREEHDDPVDA